MMGIMIKTKSIRVRESSWKRLKIRAARAGKNLMEIVDELA